jgi:hypothetical protein
LQNRRISDPGRRQDNPLIPLNLISAQTLTAYDTQRIKRLYSQVAGADMLGKTAIMGALSLYLDFINLFIFDLQFVGNRRERAADVFVRRFRPSLCRLQAGILVLMR